MTINYGSIICCRVKSVKTNYDNLTLSLSAQVLTSLNADQLIKVGNHSNMILESGERLTSGVKVA